MPQQARTIGLGWLALVALLALLATGGAFVYSALGTPVPAIGMDPFGIVSAFSIRGWESPPAQLQFPDQICSIDGVPIDGTATRNAVLSRIATLSSRGHPYAELAFKRNDRTIVARVRVSKIDRFSVGGLYLLHAAIATALFGSALLVLVAANKSKSARAYAVVGLSGAVFLSLLLDYHLLARGAPVFVLFFAATSAALINFARVYPDDIRSRPLHSAFVVASALFLSLGVIGFVLALRGRVFPAVVVGISVANAIALGALTVRLLTAFARATPPRRRQLRSSIVGIVSLSCTLLFTQLLAWLPSERLLQLMAPVSGMLMLLVIAHGLLKHNVFEARTIVSKSSLSTPLVAIALSAALAMASAIELTAGHAALSPAILVAAAAPIGWATYVKLRSTIDDLIFRSALLYRPLVAELAQRVTLADSKHSVVTAIRGALLESGVYANIELSAIDALSPQQQSSLRRGEFTEGVDTLGTRALLTPMITGGELRAALVLVPHTNRLLSSDDIVLAVTAATLGALALHHLDVLAERDSMRRAEISAEQVDKATALGTLASEVLHELQAPLHFLKSFMTGSLGRASLAAELEEVARDETTRLERLVTAARRMRPPDLSLSWHNLAEVVATAVRIVEATVPTGELQVSISVGSRVSVLADRDRLIQVFVNLLRNAAEATSATHAALGVVAECQTSTSRANCIVDVWDDGPGVDEQLESQLFQAFRSTRPNGMGLGLVVCARVVRELGWEIQYVRHEGTTRFRISIPSDAVSLNPVESSTAEESDHAAPATCTEDARRGRSIVRVVDPQHSRGSTE